MSLSARQGRGLVAFRLCEIPLGVRLRAKQYLLSLDQPTEDGLLVPVTDPFDLLDVGVAAETPSDKLHWIPRSAWNKVMAKHEQKMAAKQEAA